MYDFVGINPGHPYLVTPDAQIPLGLLYVLGAARDAGFQVAVSDATGKKPPRAVSDLPEAKVYGITATVTDYPMAEQIARYIKAANYDSKVILGGPVFTALEYIDFTWFDSLIRGEPEEQIESILVDCIDGNEQKVYNCGITDPDFTKPAYDLWEGKLGGKVLLNKDYEDEQSCVFLTSRGCPYNCVFCCARTICKGVVRFRDMDSIFEDVDYLVNRGVKVLRLSDENFTTRPDRVEEFCNRIRPYYEKHGLVWRPSFRADFHDQQLLNLMSASGCIEASIGIESADEKVLEAIQKRITTEDQRQILDETNKAGIDRRALLMCGCPGTNEETLEKNAKFILSDSFETVSLTVFTPLPGTPIWEDPAAFRCDIRPEAKELDNLCFYFYGPSGVRQLDPFIDLWDFPYDRLRNNINTQRGLLDGLGRANRG